MNRRSRTTSHAFTLIELLVVMAVIAIAMGITLPAINAMRRAGQGSAALNAISTATNAAHIYSHRVDRSDLGGGGSPPFPPDARHSGTAAVFTPANEIRLTVNDQTAVDLDDAYIDTDSYADADGDKAFAYEDIQGIDYVSIPGSARVVGVQRTGPNTTDINILLPPFAIRFNEFGHLATDHDYIYYNNDPSSSVYDTDDDRAGYSGGYDADARDQFDPRASDVQRDIYTGRYPLPFQKIEVVNAIIAYNPRDFRTTGGSYSDPEWFLENGSAINLSPLTGLSIRASQ